MADNHARNGSSAGEDEGLSTVAHIDEAAAEGSGDSLDQMDPTTLTNGNTLDSFGNETNETRTTEDGARDDMFVDCPDEIENSESQQSSEEKEIYVQVDHFNESDSGIKIQHLMAEMERLSDSYENSVAEKENYKAEITLFMKENADLRSQLEVYNEHQIQASEIANGQLEKDQQFNEIVNRILGSLSMTVLQEEFTDESPEQKIFNVEKSVTSLVEKYNLFLSETDRLRGCLAEIGLDFNIMDEISTLVFARDKFLELKENENSLSQKLSYLEYENKELVEKLENQRSIVENANSEIGRLNLEVEQEKHRYANTKEKLGMAVTKGKALVQQRDSLKQLVAEKTTELEKCLIELQEKSSALEAAEQRNELLAANEKLAAFLKESLAEKESMLQKCEEILSEVAEIEELQSTDITEKLGWLVDVYKSLTVISSQYNKLNDLFNMFKEENEKLQSEIAETKEASNQEIERQTALLMEETREISNLQAELEDLRIKYEAYEKLHHELAETREAATIEIDRLTKCLVTESQEKSYLEAELDDLRHKYEEIVEKEYQVSLEKDQIVNVLLNASGLANDHSDMNGTVNNCIAKIKEKASQIESPQIGTQFFESFQSLLYVTDMEMRLYKLIIAEEDILNRTEANRLSHELGILTQEFNSIKEEKAVMQKSIEQLEDRCGLLKDKLSMAVKKGKGLVQERENLKGSLNEKNGEIDKLKSELQQSLSAYNVCQDKITELSLAVERVSQLETSLIETKEHADQLEQFLTESNSMLQRVMVSIEDINAPGDLNAEQPVEKVKWLAGYVKEHESGKFEMEQELKNVKDEASLLSGKLSEARSSIESLEDALSMAENNLSQLFNEKKELEVSKAVLEEELQKEKENASFGTSKFEEVSVSKRALEEALQSAENEREIVLESKVLMEEQIHKLKDEFATRINKLSDADKTIQSLEDALSQAQNNISLLAEENNKLEISRADLESEIKKMTEEANSQASKLSDASMTIQSLEDVLSNKENKMADIVQEKKNAEKEISALTSKLNSCMEELAGTRGGIQNRSADISGQLSQLQLLLQDDNLSSTVDQCFSSKIESLNKMDFVIKEMRHCFLEMDYDALQNAPMMEDDTSISTTLPSHTDIALNMSTNYEVNAVDGESIEFYIEKMNERFQLKDKRIAGKLDNFSTLMDESVTHLLTKLHVTKDGLVSIMNYVTSLKQQVKDMEMDKKRQEITISSLETDVRILSSACSDATHDLESNLHKNVSELRIRELMELGDKVFTDLAEFEGDTEAMAITGDNVKLAEKLLLATRRNQDFSDLIQDIINTSFSKTDELQNKLRSLDITFHEVSEERDLYKDKISKLEIDLESQQNLSEEMKLKLHDYEEKQDHLTKRVAELSSISKTQELEDSLLSASQVKSILSKINEVEVEVPDSAFSVGGAFDSSADVRKLFYVIDNYIESHRKVSTLSHEKEELQSIIEKQILEIESLKKKIKEHIDNEKDSEKMFKDLLEIESGLKSIIQKMCGNDLIDGEKATGPLYIIPLLDKLVMVKMMEFENLQSKNEEIVTKLRGNEKLVDDLSNKVKLLEDSNQARSVVPEIEERGTSLPSLSTQSEISEIQDMGALGKSNNVPVVPSAASLRTLRKGSSDHLAINIDSDSERLINNKEPDDDKGHVFKSLNTSGLIPKQGRTVADRVDGIWVSGSRVLMSHPRGRLGLIAYWLVLHIWLLGAIL